MTLDLHSFDLRSPEWRSVGMRTRSEQARLLALQLQARMDERGETPRTLGAKLGVTSHAVRHWLRCERLPTLLQVVGICAVLEMGPSELLGVPS